MASVAVFPLASDDDDDGASDDAPPALSPPVQDVLASSSSHVWPSVSDSDSDNDATPVRDPSSLELSGRDRGLREFSEDVVVSGEDDGGEVLQLVELGHGLGEGDEEDMLEQEILEDLENSRADSVDSAVSRELGALLSEEEVERVRFDLEAESSLGSVVNGNERAREGEYGTQELPDGWLGIEEDVASSSVAHDFEYTPVKTTNLGSKRVYTLPRSEDETLPEVGSQLLAWPVGVAIEIIGFQVKLILQMASISLWICTVSLAAFTFPFRASVKATNVAVTTAVDGYTLASQIKPMVKEGVAQAGPMLRRTTTKLGFGCLAAAYVMFMLGSLLVPALFLDLFLVRRIIEEPVEFREVLHFDYRQEHPSATLSLLPPSVLAKIKDNVYPDRVLRFRVIPSSHKLQVTVFLTLPESHYNLELGMFQVSAELLSVRGQVLKRTSWPCMLRFQSSSIRYAKQVILGVPLLIGMSRESQTLGLRLFENEEEVKIPTAGVRFILQPKAGFPRGQGLPQVYSAEAQVLSVLPWAKDILRRWKWTFYVWSGLSLFMFEVMVVLCCCHQLLLPSKLLQGITEGFGESKVIVRETVTRRASKPGRRVNFSDELPTARVIRDPAKERELLLGSAESTSTITGPRLRRLSSSGNNPDVSSEASSSWSVPPLKTLDYVGGKVEAVEGSVKTLGDSVVDSATEGVRKVKEVLDPKTVKSD